MKIIIKIIILYYYTFNFILTFVRTSEEGTVIILNKILRYFTCKSSFLNIDICVLLEYIIITLLPYLEYPKNEDVIRKTAEFSGNNFDQATNDLDLRAH